MSPIALAIIAFCAAAIIILCIGTWLVERSNRNADIKTAEAMRKAMVLLRKEWGDK